MNNEYEIKNIYDKHKNDVFNLALNYVQNIEDAEEITQDVFVKIHKNLKKFEQRANIKTWIYRITINTSLDFIKSKNAKKRFSFFSTLFHSESNEPLYHVADFNHPGVELEQREAIENIFKKINELPERQKTAIILSKIEGKSQKEISEIMKINEKAIESLIQRAKSALSQKIYSQNKGKT